jgi:hypothetical protein
MMSVGGGRSMYVHERRLGRRVNWAPGPPRELSSKVSVEAALWLLMAQIGGSCGWLARWSLRSTAMHSKQPPLLPLQLLPIVLYIARAVSECCGVAYRAA